MIEPEAIRYEVMVCPVLHVSADAHGYANGPLSQRRDRVESWQKQMLIEQRRTNELLVMLIEALADSDGDPDAEPMVYMDGTPVHD